MSKHKPMHMSKKPSTPTGAIRAARIANGHTLVLRTTAAGKTSYDLLRLTEQELRQVRRKPAEGRRDAGDEAWA